MRDADISMAYDTVGSSHVKRPGALGIERHGEDGRAGLVHCDRPLHGGGVLEVDRLRLRSACLSGLRDRR